MSMLRRLRRDAPPRRGETAAAVTLGAATVAANIGLMATSAELIQRAALHPAVLSLGTLIVAVRFFGIARGLLRYLERLVSHDAALRLLADVRLSFFRALVPRSPGGLSDRRSGDLLRRFVDDVDSLQDLYLRALAPPLVAAVTGVITVVLLSLFAVGAALVAGVGLLVGGVVVPLGALALGRGHGSRVVRLRAQVTTETVDLLRAGPELVLWGGAGERLAHVAELDRQLRAASAAVARRAALLEAASVLAAGLTVVGVLAAGVSASAAGRLDPVHLGLLALVTMASFEAVAPLPGAFQTLDALRASAARLYDLVDVPVPVPDPPDPVALPPGPALVMEDLGCRYAADRARALDGVDLDLRPGRRVAVVGPSGAGKSTLAAVLERFVPYGDGHLWAGADPSTSVEAARVAADGLRGWLALSGQDAHVFAASVAANLRLARIEATDGELVDVLERVGLGPWLARLPDGLATELGDDASRASGGERQRLVLARALLRDAPILVLDEPTAHLDELTARELHADLVELVGPRRGQGTSGQRERGLLLLTHDPYGLEWMDEILVLRDGRVVERGTHAELEASGGSYARVLAPHVATDKPEDAERPH